ncbi:MAG: type II secretion system protein [Candidatus Gracilibacteria bacterium]|nr:type II secretion system protein [Candidatus Gracilibacteria bacterium]
MINKKQRNNAFTLVELIVTVTILAILLVIVFIYTTGYIENSRDGVRLNDLGTIEEALKINYINAGKYPLPTDFTEVTYSGGLLWRQGFFGENTHVNLGSISKLPVDPLFSNRYDYSTISNSAKYQLSSIFESDKLFTYKLITSESYALNSLDTLTYVTGDYGLYDTFSKNNNNCFLITTPSLFISNESFTGDIDISQNYNYVLNDGNNISKTYISKLKINTSFDDFQPNQVYDKCSIDTIDDFNLYISKLSLAYQQLNGIKEFDKIIYDYNELGFRQGAISNLILNGVEVSQTVVNSINNPTAGNIFRDTFLGADNTQLVSSHTPDTYGNWTSLGSIVGTSYTIEGNKLQKNDNLNGVIIPVPILPITSRDKTILFDINDFGGGSIIIYTNYTDDNNYYGIEISNSGYTLVHKVGGVQTSPYPLNVNDTISTNSQIELSISGNNVKLKINNIEKENIIDATAIFEGSPAINMTNQNAKIDNFTLIYR